MKIIYDLETNGLIPEVSNIWIAVCKNIETNEITTFSDHDKDSKPLNELLPFLNKCEILIGHNIINYDNVVLHTIDRMGSISNLCDGYSKERNEVGSSSCKDSLKHCS